MELRASGERRQLLVVLDDYSRFCVGHRLGDGPSAEVVIATMQAAIARHGKPEAVRTDRGGGFLSKDFEAYLEAELIDHIVGRAYHPQGGGKVESLVGTVRRELWDIEHFDSWDTATRRLDVFFADYNEHRAHMGIDGLTPREPLLRPRRPRPRAHRRRQPPPQRRPRDESRAGLPLRGAGRARARGPAPRHRRRADGAEVLRLESDPGFRHALSERKWAIRGREQVV